LLEGDLSRLFQRGDINRIGSYFKALLRSIVQNPEIPVSELEILSEADRKELLVDFNDTEADYPRDRCIHELFEEQVERVPDHIAVVCGDEQLSYGELNFRANQLAHYLRRHGVGPEVRVGLCVDRSVEMLIGLLGMLG